MATFIGTNKEFRRYLGPMLRNLVQQFTKRHKKEISACEHCGTAEQLDSAHVRNRGRNEIINLILSDFTSNDIVKVDVVEFERRFIAEHQPLEKSILILCRSCHQKYDLQEPQLLQKTSLSLEKESTLLYTRNCLPITLEPANASIFKQELLLTKKAIIETYFSDGKVERKSWDASKFKYSSNVFGNLRSRHEYRPGSWQTKGIIKVHVRVLKNA